MAETDEGKRREDQRRSEPTPWRVEGERPGSTQPEANQQGGASEHSIFARVLCGVDGTPEGLFALQQAIRLRVPEGDLWLGHGGGPREGRARRRRRHARSRRRGRARAPRRAPPPPPVAATGARAAGPLPQRARVLALNALIADTAGDERVIVLDPDFEAVAGLAAHRHKPEHAWREFAERSAAEMPRQLVRAAELALSFVRPHAQPC